MKRTIQSSFAGALLVAIVACGDRDAGESYGETAPVEDAFNVSDTPFIDAVDADESDTALEDAGPDVDDGSSQDEERTTPPPDSLEDTGVPDTGQNPTFSPTPLEIALHYAPIWYQDTANGGPDNQGAKADIPTTADYDGDLQHNNNWDSLPGTSVAPSLYFGISITASHYFLTYSQYHPRDWEAICLGLLGACHEGDLESIWIIARRNSNGFGTVVLVRTHHHGQTTTWSNESEVGQKVTVSGDLDFEDTDGNVAANPTETMSHVRIFSEAHGHGTAPCTAQKLLVKPFGILNISCPDADGKTFPGGDGIKFVPTTNEPKIYQKGMENTGEPMAYALVPISETLWQWRHEIGKNLMYQSKGSFIYSGGRGVPFVSDGAIGSHFDVEQFPNDDSTGKVPWFESLEGSEQGDVFLDPAWAYKEWLDFGPQWSLEYSYHPYLDVAVLP